MWNNTVLSIKYLIQAEKMQRNNNLMGGDFKRTK